MSTTEPPNEPPAEPPAAPEPTAPVPPPPGGPAQLPPTPPPTAYPSAPTAYPSAPSVPAVPQSSVWPFSIGETIGWSWTNTWRNFWRFLLVAVVFFAITSGVSMLVNGPSMVVGAFSSNGGNEPSIAVSGGLLVLSMIGAVVQLLVSTFLGLGLIRIALAVTRGEKVQLPLLFSFAGYGNFLLCSIVISILAVAAFAIPFGLFTVVGVLVGHSLGVALIVLGGLLGLAVVIVVTIGFAFYGYAIVDQGATGLSGLSISWRIVRPRFWSVFGLGILLALIGVGLFIAAVVLGVLALIIGLLVTLPVASVLAFGIGSLSYANAYRRLSGQPVSA